MKNHLLCLGALAAVGGGAYYMGKKQIASHCNISPERCSLRTGMRKLWSDHVWWTRNYLICATQGLPDTTEVTNRLLKNQDDIGAAIVPFYGKEAGDKLTALLREHIVVAAEVVAAAKANDSAKLDDANKRWHVNADEIATFLSSANAAWPQDAMQKMMYDHLQLTTDEAVALLKKEWQGSIDTFEKVFEEIMMMADDLTTGIAKQFPEKF